jgi:hypothetical protein
MFNALIVLRAASIINAICYPHSHSDSLVSYCAAYVVTDLRRAYRAA